MKLVKKFLFAVLLTSALAVSTYAGDLETPGYVPPPPPPPDHSMSYTATTDEAPSVSAELVENTAELSDQLLYDAFMAMLSVF